mgnify:CR=1 FL=1|tara:strand:+ start:1391 stop:1573 length:183 start_codon:yes stop_codon:yes gene_type:complete
MVSYIHNTKSIEFVYYYDVFIKLWTVIKYDKNDNHLGTEYYNTKENLKIDNPNFKFIKGD